MENEKVTYHCDDCGTKFEVDQGSRQKYCPDCLIERIRYKGKKRKRR